MPMWSSSVRAQDRARAAKHRQQRQARRRQWRKAPVRTALARLVGR